MFDALFLQDWINWSEKGNFSCLLQTIWIFSPLSNINWSLKICGSSAHLLPPSFGSVIHEPKNSYCPNDTNRCRSQIPTYPKYILHQGQLQIWTEHYTLIFENLKPVEKLKNHFSIVWTSLKVVLIFKIRRVRLKN